MSFYTSKTEQQPFTLRLGTYNRILKFCYSLKIIFFEKIINSIQQSIFYHKAAIEFADRFNTALVCHRWNYLACHPRLWLRVDRSVKELSEPGVFPNIETAVSASRHVELMLFLYNSSFFFGLWILTYTFFLTDQVIPF